MLEALEQEAATHQRPVVVFIDEIQDVATRWVHSEDGTAVQRELERMMRKPGRLVTYAFAGSERATMEQLFAPGMPLRFEGERYALPPIAASAWRDGITERFARDRRAITIECVDRMLAATDGQPLRTMQVCRQALRLARRQRLSDINGAVVDEGVAEARRHPSWEQADS